MSSMVGTISWMESSAAPWSTMTGMDTGSVPTRHPTLFVGRRRVFAQIKRARSNRRRRERLLFRFDFRRIEEGLGGLQYDRELWSPDKK